MVEVKLTEYVELTVYNFLPQDAIMGSSGCLAIDLMLPEHLPIKHPISFLETTKSTAI